MPTGVVEALASEKYGRWFSFDDRKVRWGLLCAWMAVAAKLAIINNSNRRLETGLTPSLTGPIH